MRTTRSNLVLYHGVFAANSSWRERIVKKRSERKNTCASNTDCVDARPNHSWSELLRRGLDLDSLECPKKCGGRLRFIACIDQPAVIARILRHVDLPAEPVKLEPARAPPDEWQLGPAA